MDRSRFATSTQSPPFTAMLVSRSRGACLIPQKSTLINGMEQSPSLDPELLREAVELELLVSFGLLLGGLGGLERRLRPLAEAAAAEAAFFSRRRRSYFSLSGGGESSNKHGSGSENNSSLHLSWKTHSCETLHDGQ